MPLRQDVITPRPCAKHSVDLEPVDYNRGDPAIEFSIDFNSTWILTSMTLGRDRTSIINSRGNDGSKQASFSDDMLGKITFNTTNPTDIGLNHFTIRNCDV